MRRTAAFLRLLGAALAAVMLMASVPASANDGVPMPQLAKPKGEKCVEPTDYMRRNHMDLLKHQRDETMHKGIRTKKYSWKGCVECHAATHPDIAEGKVPTLYPFCAQCHHYAAVQIDCIQCHTTVPESVMKSSKAEGEADKLMTMMKGHLGETEQR
ncbi:MAG: Hdr-like menaquinol oxidoreductase cytochrome c subunit [Rhodospirillales bacterium]|nr:Hdr-like menaquinol oxidoreductase cytochrome c subunit [Rhodospirillales bacterium]MCW8862354.1 Hdr-like menaquinol oxidoreductase cytochrome c subunit [Rhodospirillales bacterium]MCW8953176.1 Hdr-like menaquinol oxidoreductase cytochrome c subunit [Rhodospirillales bacterium]MCW8969619.1 Hdr-like menaquinol oxidoreductase cytochrome c subunit [Rhodospirillales bacterium]MCW9001076.1 Hdr-like menaquinol oxidoreductase cytochrome c subunit [Rhodospirillales bacterium]